MVLSKLNNLFHSNRSRKAASTRDLPYHSHEDAEWAPPDRIGAHPAAVLDKSGVVVNLHLDSGLLALNLHKNLGKHPILRNVSLHIQRGEIVGLLGPNGAGKTTCFHILIGAIRPDRGHILFDGVDGTNLPIYARARRGVGYLPQEQSIFRGLTVEENIRAVVELTQPDPRLVQKRTLDLMDEFAITHLRTSMAPSLSGGERRRCEIARALASEPGFLLLDEPFAGIDPLMVGDIQSLILHLRDRGVGVLITDHNIREILDLVDRAYILRSGSLLAEGSPNQIINNETVRKFYLGTSFRI